MWTWSALACREPEPAQGPGVVLNEVLARNDAGWEDPDGTGECPEHDDFVELFNAGRTAVDVGGWSLSDASPGAFALPHVVLGPGEHLVVVADEAPEQGPLHAPFGVSADGETLSLHDARGALVDRVDVPALDPDVAWGRYGDGAGTWRAQAAPSPGAPNEAPPDDSCLVPRPGFDDHTVPCIGTAEGFAALAIGRAGLEVVKFEILGWPDPDGRHAVFLDSRFYALHDEWYLFRMLNGQDVEGEDHHPSWPGDFATIDAIYAWAAAVDIAALFPTEFVTWTSTGRLTSPRFYELALGDVRVIGAGTLIRVPPRDRGPERWAFELEYSDEASEEDVVAFFHVLEAQLAPDIADALLWLVRSPAQETVAAAMEAGGSPYGDRLLRYDELTTPGTVEVYRGGTVAGRVRIVRAGEALDDTTPEDVLVLDDIPDYLPPCAALITSVPQTPLAHIALLAESRGIPNLHVAGITDDPQWDSLGRLRLPVAVRATAPDGFAFVELTSEEYATWLALSQPTPPVFDPPDPSSWPWTVDLEQIPIAEMEVWRPGIGGKGAGFVALLDTDGVVAPDHPLSVSVRAYAEHVDAVGLADEVLAAPEFGDPGDPRIRYLVLEGREAYDDRYPEPGDAAAADAWLGAHADVLGDLARGDGLRGAVASAPLPPEVEDEVLPVIRDRFSYLAPVQGLRFRSSSNVEDAEGFNGAGLYASYTGYLDPAEGDGVDVALRQAWASYWGAEAFEERHLAGIPHEDGAMAVVVHPNFDDADEVSNGVVTATLLPDGGWDVRINAQIGAISVTNPPVDACTLVLPEVVRVTDDGLERLQQSTEADLVLDDAKVLELAAMAEPVVTAWLAVQNAALTAEQQRSTLTLDFEFREVVDGWPGRVDGATFGQRLVLKQARSLEPSIPDLPDEVVDGPFPRDVLARAHEVSELACGGATLAVSAVRVETDPAKTPDLGYAELPFVGQIDADGQVLTWLDLATVVSDGETLAATTTADAAARTGIVAIAADGATVRVERATGADEEPGACAATVLWAAPDTFLDELLAE